MFWLRRYDDATDTRVTLRLLNGSTLRCCFVCCVFLLHAQYLNELVRVAHQSMISVETHLYYWWCFKGIWPEMLLRFWKSTTRRLGLVLRFLKWFNSNYSKIAVQVMSFCIYVTTFCAEDMVISHVAWSVTMTLTVTQWSVPRWRRKWFCRTDETSRCLWLHQADDGRHTTLRQDGVQYSVSSITKDCSAATGRQWW